MSPVRLLCPPLAHRALAAVTVVFALGARPGLGSEPRAFTVRAQKEWLEGESRALRISATGEVTLGPAVASKVAIEEPVIWSLAAAADGSVWVGTGSGGRLYRVTKDGERSAVATLPEAQVTALLADGDGVLAATSPDGAVYRVRPGARPEEIARPKTQYLWTLVRGRDQAVYAGSGVEGVVWRIADGKAEEWYRSPDLHVTSLMVRSDGSLVAGTAERGLVLRIEGPGKAQVLHDSGLKEVRALLEDERAGLWAAINGGSSYRDGGARPGEASMTVTSAPAEAEGAQAGQPPMTLPAPETLGEMAAELVRLGAGGELEVVARTKGELVYGLAPSGGEILAGSARRLLIAGRPEEEPGVLALEDGGQVSALARGSAGLWIATTGPSRVWLLGSAGGREGSYTSRVLAADGPASWGTLRWDAELPSGASLQFETRSGGSAEPDTTWSEWRKLEPGSDAVSSPPGRFVQVRVQLAATGAGSPRLRGLTLGYQVSNQAPVVRSFRSEPPGVVFQKAAQGQNVVEVVPPPLPSMFEELGAPKADPGTGQKRLYRRGAQTLSWEVADPDEDELHVRLSVRPRDGGPELTLRDRPDGSPFTFDTEALPDGWWIARLHVDDAGSNPEGTARRVVRDSEPFLVDNTAPRLERIAEGKGSGRVLRLRAHDGGSGLWKAEWSADGGPFSALAAEDGITDGVEDRYAIDLARLPGAPKLVVVRVTDRASMSTTLRLEPGSGATSAPAAPGDER